MIEFEYRRINFNKDLNEIISLIHKNLDSNFTLEFFIWKHLNNPFGESYGLLGLHNGKIVGLRLFMYWEFVDPNTKKVIKAIRPVDTITDIKYRGKGLFKILTLEGLKNCSESYDLVFNTPNSNSLPGYLKMGWDQIAEIENFKLSVINPFLKAPNIKEIDIKNLNISGVSDPKKVETNKNLAYLKWRYSLNDYRIFQSNDTLIILTIEKINGIRTFLIYEIIGDKELVRRILSSLGRKFKVYTIYYYNNTLLQNIKFPININRKKANVVYRNHSKVIEGNFNFSLGDLESKL